MDLLRPLKRSNLHGSCATACPTYSPSAEPLFRRALVDLESAAIADLLAPAEAPMVRAMLAAATQRPGVSAPLACRAAEAMHPRA